LKNSKQTTRRFREDKSRAGYSHSYRRSDILSEIKKNEGEDELKKIVLEGIEEHRQVKMFLKELARLSYESEKFNAKLKVVVEDSRAS